MEKLFCSTGGRLSASVSTAGSRIKLDPVLSDMWGIPESFYQNKIALTYTHPLLKKRKGFLDRLQYELKQFDINFSEVQVLENQETFLGEAATKFLHWTLLTEQVKIVTERLKLSEEELKRTQRKRAANLVDEVDVIRTEDAVRGAAQSKVLVEAQWKALQSELAVFSQKEDLIDNSPEFDLYTLKTLSSLDQSMEQLKQKSRLLKTIQVRVEQLELARRGYEETEKADLSLFAQMNTKNLDEEVAKSLNMDKYDVAVGLQLRVPLKKRTAKSNITKTDLQLQQLKAHRDDVEIALTSALTNIHIQIKEMEKVLQLNQEQIESAEQKTTEELKLYNQGRGSLTFVIQSRDSEERAKLLYAQNAVTYHQLLIQYRALMDELL